MTERPNREARRRKTAASTNEAGDEEAVRRIARHFLATPPQPKRDAPKESQKPEAQAKRQGR